MPPSLPDPSGDRIPGQLVLASGSPRRRDLLSAMGIAFEVIPADIPEIPREGEAPEPMALRFAKEKARAVASLSPDEPRRWVLAADTIVVLGDRVLGKPKSPEHAVEMLMALVGRTHQVITGVTVTNSTGSEEFSTAVASQVVMRPTPREELEAYVATGEPLDKAGAYALQGEGSRFVEAVEGSETNVIGLPVAETLMLLANAARSERTA